VIVMIVAMRMVVAAMLIMCVIMTVMRVIV
jgi:hypothetical protein